MKTITNGLGIAAAVGGGGGVILAVTRLEAGALNILLGVLVGALITAPIMLLLFNQKAPAPPAWPKQQVPTFQQWQQMQQPFPQQPPLLGSRSQRGYAMVDVDGEHDLD